MDDDGDWTLVSNDHFDRDADPSVDASGLDLLVALRRLWHSTLNERVLAGGARGFVSFHLQRDDERIRVPEAFDRFDALARIRDRAAGGSDVVPDDAPLIDSLARTHLWLYRQGRDANPILELALDTDDAASFERALDQLVRQ